MQWLIACHVISVVCWFSGLFYLPRLFVYHTQCQGELESARFKIMEFKLYYYITMPSAVLTTFFGLLLWLPHYHSYSHSNWLHIKLILVLFLWGYHFACGYYLHKFRQGSNDKSERFYRVFNEGPTILLIAIVVLSFVKPFH